jgi:hypothetical protein
MLITNFIHYIKNITYYSEKRYRLNLAELENIPKTPREMIPLYENIEQKYDENDPEPEKIK